MYAKVNSGEMILNPRQQGNLFNILNNGLSNFNQPNTMAVSTIKIKGSDMYLALKNLSNIKSKVGKDIGIR